jgi:carbon monoxide dehydrogenase subunit G
MSTTIESKHVTINQTAEAVFNFLNDFNNIERLLPSDKISDWRATVDDCSFKIQNAAIIPLVKESTEPFSKINIKSGENAPFPFTLNVHINENSANSITGYLLFEGEINMFLKMMVVKPLTNLFDHMADRLKAELESAT